MSMVYYHWGSRSSETACVSALASRLGGGVSGAGIMVGSDTQRPVPRF